MVSVILCDKNASQAGLKYRYELKSQNTVKEPNGTETLVKIQAAALNHRDLWILKGMYPGIKLDSIIGADGVATIVKASTTDQPPFTVGERVLLNPGRGWVEDERGPENQFTILGLKPSPGTLTDEPLLIDNNELVHCPKHLSNAEAAALPLAGLTAYRATFTKGLVKKDQYVLITGIGGGVALFALQFAVAAGAHVYVTSSSNDKIEKAKRLGAEGGVNYKDNEDFAKEFKTLLGENRFSAIIDGAGGSLYRYYPELMRNGGIISTYGQTADTKGVTVAMNYVLKNIEIRGSTMGSRKEFVEMVKFVDEKKIKPIVSKTFLGLNESSVAEAFEIMKNGEQFGKLVIQFDANTGSPKL